MNIRVERPEDEAGVAGVVKRAFGSTREVALVEALRASEVFVPELSLVAEAEGRVVGHVMVTLSTLVMGDGEVPVHVLSPLAVEPECQGEGIGSALVREVVARAEALGAGMVILEGSPKYYGRFGFEPAYRYGIEMTLPSWASREAGQVLRLASYDPGLRGRVRYSAPFDLVAED